MSKTWKWIIGILIALAVLAIVVAVPVSMHYFGARNYAQYPEQGFQRGFERGPGMMGRYPGGDNDQYYGMMRPGYAYPGGMMRGHGFFPFGGVFTGLIGLAILGLAIYGVVALFTRKPAPAPAPVAAAPAVTHTCSNCGKPALDDWKTCPYCGTSLESQ
jgi:hypothetical protein